VNDAQHFAQKKQSGVRVVNLTAAERVLEYRFLDSKLGDVALSTWRQGFSRLEFLGDAILGLAVFSTAEVNHFPRKKAIARVANRHLDQVFTERLSEHTNSNSGDVIEALIGAVHLDSGFPDAAQIATTLCLPEHQLVTPPIDPDLAGVNNTRSLSFIGAAVLSAAIADELCRMNPAQTHRWFSEQRSAMLSRRYLARVSVQLGYSPEGDIDDERFRDAASDALEGAIGEQYLRRGWEAARASSLRITDLRLKKNKMEAKL
jgi:dsRNA-specific ribonuclease